jgi:hypothetical protein
VRWHVVVTRDDVDLFLLIVVEVQVDAGIIAAAEIVPGVSDGVVGEIFFFFAIRRRGRAIVGPNAAAVSQQAR